MDIVALYYSMMHSLLVRPNPGTAQVQPQFSWKHVLLVPGGNVEFKQMTCDSCNTIMGVPLTQNAAIKGDCP